MEAAGGSSGGPNTTAVANGNDLQEIRVPAGFTFYPTDQELLGYYLLKKITNRLSPKDQKTVRECDLYGEEEPWEIWQRFCGFGDTTGSGTDLYFFTKLKKLTSNGRKTVRSAGAGTWHNENGGEEVVVRFNVKGKGEKVVKGLKKKFSYKNEGSSQHRSWIMSEYSFPQGITNTDYVVCQLRNNNNQHRYINKAVPTPGKKMRKSHDFQTEMIRRSPDDAISSGRKKTKELSEQQRKPASTSSPTDFDSDDECSILCVQPELDIERKRSKDQLQLQQQEEQGATKEDGKGKSTAFANAVNDSGSSLGDSSKHVQHKIDRLINRLQKLNPENFMIL